HLTGPDARRFEERGAHGIGAGLRLFEPANLFFGLAHADALHEIGRVLERRAGQASLNSHELAVTDRAFGIAEHVGQADDPDATLRIAEFAHGLDDRPAPDDAFGGADFADPVLRALPKGHAV